MEVLFGALAGGVPCLMFGAFAAIAAVLIVFGILRARRRRQEMAALAQKWGFAYYPDDPWGLPTWYSGLDLFNHGRSRRASNVLSGEVDGYLIYQMNCWNRVVQTFAESGKPVLYADFQYGGSGGFLVYNAGLLRAGADHVGYVASSRLDDLVAAVQCFATVKETGRADRFAELTTRVRMARTPAPSDHAALPDPLDTLPIDDCVARMKASAVG